MKSVSLLLLVSVAAPATPIQTIALDLLASGVPRFEPVAEGAGPQSLSHSVTGRGGVTVSGSGTVSAGALRLWASAVMPGSPDAALGWAYAYGYSGGLVTFGCTGICGSTAMVALNVNISGTALVEGALADLEIWLYPFLEGPGALVESRLSASLGDQTGIFVGRTVLSFLGEVFSLPAVEVPLGVPLYFELAGGVGALVQGRAASRGEMNFLNTIQLAATPFTLPPGVTVNSADFGIVDNQFTLVSSVPEPGTAAMVLSALGLGAVWRRRPRRCGVRIGD